MFIRACFLVLIGVLRHSMPFPGRKPENRSCYKDLLGMCYFLSVAQRISRNVFAKFSRAISSAFLGGSLHAETWCHMFLHIQGHWQGHQTTPRKQTPYISQKVLTCAQQQVTPQSDNSHLTSKKSLNQTLFQIRPSLIWTTLPNPCDVALFNWPVESIEIPSIWVFDGTNDKKVSSWISCSSSPFLWSPFLQIVLFVFLLYLRCIRPGLVFGCLWMFLAKWEQSIDRTTIWLQWGSRQWKGDCNKQLLFGTQQLRPVYGV